MSIKEDIGTAARSPHVVIKTIRNIRDIVRERTLYKDIFIDQPYYPLFKDLKPNTVVVDIGAFYGETAIYFAQHPNTKTVFAYEPIPKSYSKAKENISGSPFKNKIKIINKAISDVPGARRISSSFTGTGCTDYSKVSSKKGAEVQSITLNDALKGLKNVAIKCDIEGNENRIFKDADLSNVYAVILEHHNTKEKMISTLRGKGFKPKLVTDEGEIGIIYAKR